MATSFAYPTLADATTALPTFLSIVEGQMPALADAVHDGWVVVGYGCSVAKPTSSPSSQPANVQSFISHQQKQDLAAHIRAVNMDPSKIDWGKWLPIAIQIILGILGGFGGVGGAGS